MSNEPKAVIGSNQDRLQQIEQRISEIRATLASGKATLGESRELLTGLQQLDRRWTDLLASAKELLSRSDKKDSAG